MSKPELEPVNSPDEIPEFVSEEEEAAFWATHELGPAMLAKMERRPAGLLPRPRAKQISLRVQPELLDDLKAVAAQKNVPYQKLLKRFVAEGVAVEKRGPTRRRNAGARDVPARRHREAVYVDAFPRVAGRPSVCRRTSALQRRGSVLAYSSR